MAIKTVVVVTLALATASAHADPITIQDQSTVDYHGRYHEHWLPLTSAGQPLESEDFYRTVGRPDLADDYSHRRMIAIGTLAGGLALTGASIYFATRGTAQPALQNCNPMESLSQFEACGQANITATQAAASASQSNVAPAVGLALGGAAAFAVSIWYFAHPEPVHHVGEVLARTLNLPAPGPVIGLALLTGALVIWSLCCARTERWHSAGALGMLAGCTKALGCLTALPLLLP